MYLPSPRNYVITAIVCFQRCGRHAPGLPSLKGQVEAWFLPPQLPASDRARSKRTWHHEHASLPSQVRVAWAALKSQSSCGATVPSNDCMCKKCVNEPKSRIFVCVVSRMKFSHSPFHLVVGASTKNSQAVKLSYVSNIH